jgi:subtilisin family serine protease
MSDRFAKFWSQFEAVKEAMPDRAPLVYPPTAEPGNGIAPEFVYEDGHGLFGPTVTDRPQVRHELRLGTADTDQSDKPVQRLPVHGDMLEFLDKVALRGNDATAHHLVSICPVNLCPADEPAAAEQPYWPPYNPDGGGDGVKIRVLDTGLFDGYKNITVVADADGRRRDTSVTVPISPAPTSPFGQVGGTDAGAVSGGTEQLIRLYAGHGTFIAGLIGCIAPGASVYVERSFELAGTLWEYELGPTLLYALQARPDIISLSAGGTSHCRKPYLGLQEFLEALARDDHTLLIAAAGNEGAPQLLTPAAAAPGRSLTGNAADPPSIVAVGALRGDHDGVACFSNYGPGVTVYAPGERMVGVFPKGQYEYVEPHFDTCQYHDPVLYDHCTCVTKPKPGERKDFANVARWSGTSFATPIVAAMTAAHYAQIPGRFPSPRHAFADLLKTEGKPFHLDPRDDTSAMGVRLVPALMDRSNHVPRDGRIRLA